MGSIRKTIHYCSVSKSGQIVYAYNGGDHEMEDLAALCLERTPPYHKWYFHTVAKKILGFLIDDIYVYFVIAHESLGKAEALRFVEHLRDGFKKVASKGTSKSRSTLDLLCLQEQLVPVIRNLITSLENVTLQDQSSPCNNSKGEFESGTSTKAPLLGKSNKQDKRKMKDHVIPIRDIELEEHRSSTERGINGSDSTNRSVSVSVSPISIQKDSTLTRSRSRSRGSSQNIRKEWCRQVRSVLIIDAVLCLMLFGVWLVVCNGLECVR